MNDKVLDSIINNEEMIAYINPSQIKLYSETIHNYYINKSQSKELQYGNIIFVDDNDDEKVKKLVL